MVTALVCVSGSDAVGASLRSQPEDGVTVSVPLRHQRWLLQWFFQHPKSKHILHKRKGFVTVEETLQQEQDRKQEVVSRETAGEIPE
jgi:hypothetical protein